MFKMSLCISFQVKCTLFCTPASKSIYPVSCVKKKGSSPVKTVITPCSSEEATLLAGPLKCAQNGSVRVRAGAGRAMCSWAAFSFWCILKNIAADMNLTEHLQTSNEKQEMGSHLSCCISSCIPDWSRVLVSTALYAIGCRHMFVLRAPKTVCELELTSWSHLMGALRLFQRHQERHVIRQSPEAQNVLLLSAIFRNHFFDLFGESSLFVFI